MTEHTNARMKRCADAMRAAFFAEFGRPETLSPDETTECVQTLLTLYTGQFVEGVVRFKRENRSIEETVLDAVRTFIATNQEFMADVPKEDVADFLAGTLWQGLDDAQAAKVCEERGAAAAAREAAEQAEWAAKDPQERANALCAVATAAFEAETDPAVIVKAAMQVAAGPIASTVLALAPHKRGDHLAQMLRAIRQMVELGVEQMTPRGRPN